MEFSNSRNIESPRPLNLRRKRAARYHQNLQLYHAEILKLSSIIFGNGVTVKSTRKADVQGLNGTTTVFFDFNMRL